MLPEILGPKYEVLNLLARSHFSTVYLGIQRPLGRKVLIKILAPHIAENETLRRRFEREAKILAALDDPGVVKVYDFGQEKGTAFIISEFIEGKTLKEVLTERKRLEINEALRIIKEVAEIISRIHRKGVLHRDIKPSNIILKEDGRLKLTDFGLAQTVALDRLTIDGEIIGTPAYMSPEQISGRPIDQRSDIFSLGVVAYELLTGENPFVAETFTGVLHKVLNQKPEKIKDLPPAVAKLLEKMLAKNPKGRFQSGEEISVYIGQIFLGSEEVVGKKRASLKPLIFLFGFILIFLFIFIFREKVIPHKQKITLSQEEMMTSKETTGFLRQESLANKVRSEIGEKGKIEVRGKEIPLRRLESIPPLLVESGYLRVKVEPWADVYAGEGGNMRYIGQTPIAKPIRLKSGAINIRFRHPVIGIAETTIAIAPKETTEISFYLRRCFSGLKVFAEPWAEVYIDGEYKGMTPMGVIYLSPGRHELSFKNPKFSPLVETVEFKPGETKERYVKWR